jgi:hypothetical protein
MLRKSDTFTQMRTPANFKLNNRTSLLRIQYTNLLLHFHSVLCEKLRQVKWERDQEELEELRILLPLEDEFFGDFKDPWFEGEDQPGFPSIATILNN